MNPLLGTTDIAGRRGTSSIVVGIVEGGFIAPASVGSTTLELLPVGDEVPLNVSTYRARRGRVRAGPALCGSSPPMGGGGGVSCCPDVGGGAGGGVSSPPVGGGGSAALRSTAGSCTTLWAAFGCFFFDGSARRE